GGGGNGDDQAQRPRRIRLRPSDARKDRECGSTCRQTQKLSAGKFHPSLISLFDHLVGAGEQRRRNFEAKRLGGRQVDDEIELGRVLGRQGGGGCAFLCLAGVQIRFTIQFLEIGSVAHH